MPTDPDRVPTVEQMGDATSNVLIEVRSVLSRARTALDIIKLRPHWYLEYPKPVFDEVALADRGKKRGKFLHYDEGKKVEHPGILDIVKALETVIDDLAPFASNGRKYKHHG